MKYCEICLQKPDTYTYENPSDMDLKVGDGVICPFGKQSLRGFVVGFSDTKPKFATKEVSEKLDIFIDEPSVKIAQDLAKKYKAPLYKCLRLFIPKNIWAGTKSRKPKEEPKEIFTPQKNLTPTPEQAAAITAISDSSTYLLHGATGSGKTFIYREKILEKIRAGKSAILLVPEIALTTQTISFFLEQIPQEQVAIWHSGLTDSQRAQIWKNAASGEIKLVIGSRSAIFTPMQDLGIIVLDEEQSWTYKQDTSPRYDAREVAELLAKQKQIPLILGSATPRIETYHKAKTKEIKLLELPNRISKTAKNETIIYDLRTEKSDKFSQISHGLELRIAQKLADKEQIILFLNRRGMASSVLCRDCGHIFHCPHCDRPLTYHEKANKSALLCHLCGHVSRTPSTCPECKSTNLFFKGGGTQTLEQELKTKFPEAKILRADRDSVKKAEDFQNIYQQFKAGEADILIGTQMIAQGLDFPSVSLVGVILADMGLNLPDFRTQEYTYSLLSQVSGRAGRGQSAGTVFIQTFNPENKTLNIISQNDYKKFYEKEIAERMLHAFPPFRDVLKINIKHAKKENCYEIAKKLYKNLEKQIKSGEDIFIAPSFTPRMHGKFHWNIFIFSKDTTRFTSHIDINDNVKIDINPSQTI